MDFDNKEKEYDWDLAEKRLKKALELDAVLKSAELDDRITDVTDGKDLLQPDAFDYFAPDYIPRRGGDGERGRHEAPAPEIDFQLDDPEEEEEENPVMDPADPRYAAPERPRVLVADKRPTVYVTPEGDFEGGDAPVSGGGNGGKSWMLAIVITLAILAAVLAAVLGVLRGGSLHREEAVTTPVPTAETLSTETPQPTDAPEPTEAPEETPAPTEPPAVNLYTVTVTAGTGGSISPSGAIALEEGESVTFTITADSGYVLTQLMVDGDAVSLTDTYTFRNVAEDHTIYAVFQRETTPTPESTPEPTPEPTAEPTAEPTPEPTPEPTAPPAAEPESGVAEEGTEAAE